MAILGLDHVQIAAPAGCEPEARRFFGELLGLEEVAKPDSLRARGGVWFRCGAQELHVGAEPAGSFAAARRAHPAFRVAPSEIAPLAERLALHGAPVEWDSSIAGLSRFFTADPWGNRIELTAARADAPGSEGDAPAVTLRWSNGEPDMEGAFALRERVFCGEQGVSREEELDGRDAEALHLVALEPHVERVVGTLRLLFEQDVAKVGRVAVERDWRRRGIAARMLALALAEARRRGARSARLAAQTDAIELYEQAGFGVVSDEFMDAGIVHVWMARPLDEPQ